MRTKLLTTGAVILAGSIIGAPAALAAPAVVTVDGQMTGKETPKLDKKKFKGVEITVATTMADQANPAGLPPKPTQVVVTYDKKNVKFDNDAVPKCDPSQIAGTTTEAARDACGDAEVGTGRAVANLPFGAGGARQDFIADVTAFNRADTEGILLHSRLGAPLNTTTLLTATLSKGYILTVTVPPIAGGAGSSSEFSTTVKAGKYVQARCKNKTIDYDAVFSFSDAPEATASDEQQCKRKKSKK